MRNREENLSACPRSSRQGLPSNNAWTIIPTRGIPCTILTEGACKGVGARIELGRSERGNIQRR